MGLCFGAPVKASLGHSDTRPSNSRTYDSTSTFKSTSSDSTWKSSSMEVIDELPLGGQILPNPKLKVFTYADLKSCTRNFRTDTIIGEGGFGRVYRGWVDQKTFAPTKSGVGIMVAVKKMNQESMQGFEEWQSEVNFLGRLSHNNLVKLLGYCWEERELLLVYELMPKGNLEGHLFRRGSNHHPLSWDLRIRIAIGAARGLVFLHSLQIIYRDFKASNILLDSKYNAKLSDFGLARNGPDGERSHITTRIIGTYGYAAPEYVSTGHLYVKSDVYGFGVVLLEMLTGLRALDAHRPVGQQNLIDWAKPFLSVRKKVRQLMDPNLDEKYPPAAAWKAAQLTLKCIASHHNSRPSMAEVLESLEEIEKIQYSDVESRNSKIVTCDGPKTPSRNRYSATDSRYAHGISTRKGS